VEPADVRRLTNVILLALALTFSASAGAADEIVKIGSASAVSGPSAHAGKDTENGARMAVEDLNAKAFTIDGADR
jgi:branched-chain amino acid transport system substrate-binding protein